MQGSDATVAVVGGGPAGVAAAYQCKREGIENIVLIEKERIGGLIRYANKIENIPGFMGMEGRAVAQKLENLLEDADIVTIGEEVEGISKEDGFFKLIFKNDVLRCRYLIIATGTVPRTLGIPGEICHPPWRDYSGERVLVVGGGDAAYDYALRINRFGGDVTILSRNVSAVGTLLEQVKNAGISEEKGEIRSWEKEGDVYVIRTADNTYSCDLMVTAIGRTPNIPAEDHGEVEFPNGKTSVPGLYVIGSSVLGRYRQLTLCWGMGIAAAMDIERME
ncbi:MAG: NAD(P)/FAD-dependent oxidoreductase [Thermoplasmata archaeon]